MKQKNKKPKLSKNEFEQHVLNFFEKQQKFKKIQSQFNNLKAQFNSDMKDYFECEGISKISINGRDEGSLVVNCIQKSSVEFNADKLEKVLDKELSNQIINKHYEVIDIDVLVVYLKECNVDPKIFKSFLKISRTVDVPELERLDELGKITTKQTEQIKDCCTVKNQNPYFTVSLKRGQSNGEEW